MKERLIHLLDKQIAGTLTPRERWELMGLVLEPSLQNNLQEYLGTSWDKTGDEHGMAEDKIAALFRQVGADDKDEAKVIGIESAGGRRWKWKPWAVAASLLLLIGLGAYFLFFNNKTTEPGNTIVQSKDIEAPGSSKATITLANGKKVFIDSLTSVDDGTVRLVKNDNGQVVYNGNATGDAYNVLDNPKGSTVAAITLIDGTKVWLNAASSLKYFTGNAGAERKVEITGEAYFEVAKDKQRPFIVKKGATSVTVLGTHFNVNGYDDDDELKITLLEGSVRVAVGSGQSTVGSGQSVTLKPGEQARIAQHASRISVNGDVDLEEVMAWKNGKFNFGEGLAIENIMKQLARWYDVDIKYESKINTRYGGTMSRNINIAEVLKNIEKTGGVHFAIEGRTIIVKP